LIFDVNIVIGIGDSSAISTPKIIKITAVKKNRDEKGGRAEFFGSNPHSNGDLVARCLNQLRHRVPQYMIIPRINGASRIVTKYLKNDSEQFEENI
jgi:hypothetical protein